MKWNPQGLIIAVIVSVIKAKLPPEINITWGSLVDVISAALSDIELSEITPREMYEKKFEMCVENLLSSPSAGFELGDLIPEIIKDLGTLNFQFDSNFSKDTAVSDIRKVLSKHNIYEINIDDKILCELADSIYLSLENAVQENVQSLSYYTLKRLNRLENKVDQYRKVYDTDGYENFNDKWITKKAIEPSRLYVILEQESDIINTLSKSRKIAITGTVGGVGKTELARHLCQTILEKYKYVGWIDYSGNLERDITQSLVEPFSSQGRSIEQLFILDTHHANELILFVDNVSHDALTKDVSLAILRQLSCSVVVTSRVASIFDFFAFKIMPLSLEKAAIVFEQYYTGKTQSNLKHNETVASIIELAGYHPLLIELIARNARKRYISRKDILFELQDNGFALSGNVGSNWNYFKNETIIAQLKKLYDISSLSKDTKLLETLKCFYVLPSYPIPYNKVKAIDFCLADGTRSIDVLSETGWIIGSSDGYYMHDVVKSVVFNSCDIYAKDCDKILNYLNILVTTEMQYRKSQEFIPIFLYIVSCLEAKDSTVELARVFNNLCMLYANSTDYSNAKYWNNRAIRTFKKLPESDETLFGLGVSYINLANTMSCEANITQYHTGLIPQNVLETIADQYHMGIDLFDRLIKMDKYNDVEWFKYMANNGLASVYRLMGKHEDAILLMNTVTEEKLSNINIILNILEYYYSIIKLYPQTQKDYTKWEQKLEVFLKFSTGYKEYFPFQTSDFMTSNDYMPNWENVKSKIIQLEDELYNKKLLSLAKSCDMAADLRISIADITLDQTERVFCYQQAEKWSKRARYLSSILFMEYVSPVEGNIYSTAAMCAAGLGYGYEAYQLQEYAIRVLEEVFFKKTDSQEVDCLVRAYNNMYFFTGNSEWLDKKNHILKNRK